jgi:predicted MFS family arabinose efflux permease
MGFERRSNDVSKKDQEQDPGPGRTDHAAAERNAGWRGWLGVLALSLGCFSFVSTELSPVGLLPQIAGGLHTSVGTAGLLVTGFALVVALSAAPLTVLVGGLSRRRLMALLLLASTVGNVVASLAEQYWLLLAARIMVALAIGVFWSTAAGTADRLVPERHSVRATTVVIGGLSLAAVIGVPLATALGQAAGWHAAFAALAATSFVAMLTALAVLPPLRVKRSTGISELRKTLAHGPIRTTVAVTGLTMTGTFLLFTYITPYLERVAGVGDSAIALLLVLYGAAGVIGTFGIAPLIARSFERSLITALSVLAASITLIWALGGVSWLAIVLLVPWGAAYGSLPVLLQTWVFRETAAAGIGNETASSLYVGAYNAAIAVGSFGGSLILNGAGPRPLGLVGGVLAAAAVVRAVTGVHQTHASPARSRRLHMPGQEQPQP